MLKKLIAGASLVLSLGAQAGPVEDLDALLSGHQTAQARFTQFSMNESGSRAEESRGYFAVERPNRFRWVTETPFVQEIVSDGEYIWIYDPDLEQVTRKTADEQGGSAPAMILNGQIEQLSQSFEIHKIDQDAGGVALFELLPKNAENSTFTRIRLLFEQDRISELSMQDSLGQRSMLTLQALEYDAELPDDIFKFDPPGGTDVILDQGL